MPANQPRSSLLRFALLLMLHISGLFIHRSTLSAATYTPGDIATDITFTARAPFTKPDGTTVPAGAKVDLADFTGGIVFLEWFAVWCPFCVAAAPQVETGIVEHYKGRGGNPAGIPVYHIAVNQEPASFYQTRTDAFVRQHAFPITVNDYDSTSTNRVRFRFQPTGQPVFVAINTVTNSPSHRAGQVLINHIGYGQTDFQDELRAFRAVIDSVAAPAPAIHLAAPRLEAGTFQFDLQPAPAPGTSYQIQGSSNLVQWIPLTTIHGASPNLPFKYAPAGADIPPASFFFRAVLAPQ